MTIGLKPRSHRKCPCGSKKKYRNCCGKKQQTVLFEKLPKETQELCGRVYAKRNIAEQYHKQYFGDSPSIVSCVFNNKRIVAIRGSLVVCDDPETDWAFPSDFLVSYLKTRLGNSWFNEEIKKPETESHEIIKWYFKGRTNVDKSVKSRWHQPNGSALALLHLAYDLFVLDNSNNFPERLVNRLKNNENFNGARYEVFVFATLIRAGFKIEYQDEVSGKNGRVPECRVKHTQFDEYISIEAKTRNVKGILGSKQGNKSKIRLYDKLKDAIDKNVNEPYLVFVDANLPELKVVENRQKIQKIREEFKKLETNFPNLLPNLICITNIPFHYGEIDSSPSEPAFGFMIIHKPKVELKNSNQIIDFIMNSINK